MSCYVFRNMQGQPWWQALDALDEALETGAAAAVERAYAELVAALIVAGYSSPAAAAAAALCDGEPVLARGRGELSAGLRRAAELDLARLRSRLAVDWRGRAEAVLERALPPLLELAPEGALGSWPQRVAVEEPESLLDALVGRYRACGIGVLARHIAFRWDSGRLVGVARPARDLPEELIGLDRQLGRLADNVERFLAGAPALHTLLYGPRGSGKSTAVRSLLTRYSDRGLRLVEVPPESLGELPELGESLRDAPHRFLVFVDDLAFESGDTGYQPLKTLLEGSVTQRPENVLLVATSNRRHLVRERMSDRPLPEDDDVHAWDTTNDRLALADRFGLLITFPAADQRHYLVMVRELARAGGVHATGAELDNEAIRFADWGNGYSGRTARQFVDSLVR